MTVEIRTPVRQLVAEANAEIITREASQLIDHGDDVVIVDIRDVRELAREGRIPGSVHMPRGMLEFWVDPGSPYFKEIFNEDKEFVLHCASGSRSALAAKTLKDMGLLRVSHLGGGFGAWKEAGGPVEDHESSR